MAKYAALSTSDIIKQRKKAWQKQLEKGMKQIEADVVEGWKAVPRGVNLIGAIIAAGGWIFLIWLAVVYAWAAIGPLWTLLLTFARVGLEFAPKIINEEVIVPINDNIMAPLRAIVFDLGEWLDFDVKLMDENELAAASVKDPIVSEIQTAAGNGQWFSQGVIDWIDGLGAIVALDIPVINIDISSILLTWVKNILSVTGGALDTLITQELVGVIGLGWDTTFTIANGIFMPNCTLDIATNDANGNPLCRTHFPAYGDWEYHIDLGAWLRILSEFIELPLIPNEILFPSDGLLEELETLTCVGYNFVEIWIWRAWQFVVTPWAEQLRNWVFFKNVIDVVVWIAMAAAVLAVGLAPLLIKIFILREKIETGIVYSASILWKWVHRNVILYLILQTGVDIAVTTAVLILGALIMIVCTMLLWVFGVHGILARALLTFLTVTSQLSSSPGELRISIPWLGYSGNNTIPVEPLICVVAYSGAPAFTITNIGLLIALVIIFSATAWYWGKAGLRMYTELYEATIGWVIGTVWRIIMEKMVSKSSLAKQIARKFKRNKKRRAKQMEFMKNIGETGYMPNIHKNINRKL